MIQYCNLCVEIAVRKNVKLVLELPKFKLRSMKIEEYVEKRVGWVGLPYLNY